MDHDEHDWMLKIDDGEVWNWLEGTLCPVFVTVIDRTIDACPACEQAFEARIGELLAADPARARLVEEVMAAELSLFLVLGNSHGSVP